MTTPRPRVPGALAAELERGHPGAAASLREGLGDAHRHPPRGPRRAEGDAGLDEPCEPMIECVRRTSRNVKRWHNGDMCLLWTAAGMLEAERQFRRVIGYPRLARLVVAVERDVARHALVDTPAPEVAATAV